jgi:hypothetical protein
MQSASSTIDSATLTNKGLDVSGATGGGGVGGQGGGVATMYTLPLGLFWHARQFKHHG